MANGIPRRTVYVGTVVAILALVGGFALASSNVLLTHHTQNANGDNTATSGSVNGVAYVSTELNVTNTHTMTVQNALGAPGAPVALGAGLNVFCMSGGAAGASACTEGDFSEWANYSFTTSFSGAMQVTMYMGTSAYNDVVTLWVKQATTAVAGNLVLVWDLGTTNLTLDSITVTLYQCQGAGSTCP